mgnify:CR=1 FL=1
MDNQSETSDSAIFPDQNQVDRETARSVTHDAFAGADPFRMIGDASFDMLEWHDDLVERDNVPVAPYNKRNADVPYGIEYRISWHRD